MRQAYHAKWDESLRRTVGGANSTGMVFCGRFCIPLTVFQLIFDVEHAYAEFFRSLGGDKDNVS
jgi:hypothetical protein